MPRLNVRSEHLVFCFNIPPWDLPSNQNWRNFKKEFNEQIGGVGVSEILDVVLQFNDDESMMCFVNCLEGREIFQAKVQYDILGKRNRKEFFDLITKRTGVDLLKCDAIPPFKTRGFKATAPPTRNLKRISPTTNPNRAVSIASTSSVTHIPACGYVIIKNISSPDVESIKSLAKQCGKVVSFSVKTFATVQYINEASVETAKKTLHNKNVDGSLLQVVDFDADKTENEQDSMRSVEQNLIELFISEDGPTEQQKSHQPPNEIRGISPFDYTTQSKTFPVTLHNIPEKYSLYDLVTLAEVAGKVLSVVPMSEVIVEFYDEADVQKTIAFLNGCQLGETRVEVKEYYPL
uniref:RRM domain-containing protein n=1 Tax=Ditylenchus dipsaci TaxID=166011 RepID=A0A915DZY8_9BILA